MGDSKIIKGSYWDENFVPQINEITNKFKSELENDSSFSQYLFFQEKYNESLEQYNLLHSPMKYFFVCLGLVISFILIIPFYWNLQTYKKMRDNKFQLLDEVNQANEECQNATKKLVDNLNIAKYIEEINQIFKLENVGPITKELVQEMNNWSVKKLNFDEKFNPYCTSWSIWDKNKIVIEQSQQNRIWKDKTYIGSITIPHVIQTPNGLETTYTTITRTYVHPYVKISNSNVKRLVFMKSCENLVFKYLRTKKFKWFIHRNARLENDSFNRKFDWDYNDEIQFRMIFTPYKQELFMNEYYSNNRTIPEEDQISKFGQFLCNNYLKYSANEELHLFNDIKKLMNEFANDSNLGVDWMLGKFNSLIMNYGQTIFKSTKHLWTTPIIYSENHTDIIKQAKSKNFFDYYPHYILNKILNVEIIRRDTDCFNELVSCKLLDENSDIPIYHAEFNGTSYDYAKKVKKIDGVPIDYIDCCPKSAKFAFYLAPITFQNKYMHNNLNSNLNTNSNSDFLKQINVYGEEGIEFYIDNNFVIAINKKDIEKQSLIDAFKNIITSIKQK